MRVYYYRPEEVGLTAFPPGCITLLGSIVQVTENPVEADVFVVLPDITHVSNEQLQALPYLKGNERRHVFFSISENPRRTVGIPAIIFRTDMNRHLLEAGETTTMTWPWGSANYYQPITEFKYDVCFQGWQGMTDLVHRSCQSVSESGLTHHIQINEEFFGALESRGDPAVAELRRTYLEKMAVSRLILVPQSHPTGVIRYKFYEAMAAGHVPVLIGDYSLPALSHKIDYSRCMVQIAEDDVNRTGEILTEWLGQHGDAVVTMGQYGHEMWARWLDDDLWNYTWAELVAERWAAL